MTDILSNERYEPPKVEILLTVVERGYDLSATLPPWEIVSELQDIDELYNF